MIEKFMKKAILLSIENAKIGGGPFGALIVKDNKIIANGVNSVTLNNDPTAHAEILAIRKACRKIKSYDLSGCIIFSSCEPCPMCLGAIYWAHIDKIYYANTRKDAQEIGFADNLIYSEISLPPSKRTIPFIQLEMDEAKKAFHVWEQLEDKREY